MSTPTGARRAGAAVAVGAFPLIGKGAGVARELLVAKYFRATKDVDALLLAMTPGLAFVPIVAESLRYSVLPDLSAAEASGGLRGFWARSWQLSIKVAVIGLALAVALGLGAPLWIGVLAGKAPPETRTLAIRLAP